MIRLSPRPSNLVLLLSSVVAVSAALPTAAAPATTAAPPATATSPNNGAPAPTAAPPAPFPFVIPWDDASPSVTDVAFLHDGIAGSHGRVVVRDGHFAEAGTGRRVRFLAVNLAAASAFPSHADAEKLAARLEKYGINLVRLHHMDNTGGYQPSSLIDFRYPDRQHLNPDQLDRLDYLIYQLKQHGIYSNINLHVSRTFVEADGFPPSVSEIPFDFDKRVDYFDRRMIELQKKYAHDLLTHRNPYTHQSYTDEPAVLNVELTNEDSLVGDPWAGLGAGLADLPAPFSTELQGFWNDWLSQKYKSIAAIQAGWMAGVPPTGPELLKPALDPTNWTLEHQQDTAASADVGSQEITQSPNLLEPTDDPASWMLQSIGPDAAADSATDNGVVRINVTKVDGTNWHVQFLQNRLNLQEGTHYVLTFRARSDTPHAVEVSATLDQADWHNVGLAQTVTLTPQWQDFRMEFPAARTVPSHSRVVLALGSSTGTVWVADAALRAAAPPPASPENTGPALKVTVTKVDGTDWHVQLHQTGLDLKNGRVYTVRFKSRADGRRSMAVYTGLDEPDWHHTGLSQTAKLTENWQTFEYRFEAQNTEPNHQRLSFVLGNRTGTVWLADVTLRPGLLEPPIPAGASLATHSIPIPADPFGAEHEDWIEFLAQTERNYNVEMRDYLQHTLHLQALIIGSQISYGGLAGVYREEPSDFADNHAYWQHPSFPHRPWDPVDWRIPDTSMVPQLGKSDTLSNLAQERSAGKPYTISEYNHPAPNEYQAETVPLLASFAAFQDWDAIYLFDYGSYGTGGANERIDGFFGVGSNPAKWAFLPAAAVIFRAGEIPPSGTSLEVKLPAKVDYVRYPNAAAIWTDIGRVASFRSRVALQTGKSTSRALSSPTSVQVETADSKTARYAVNSPDARVLVGFVGGHEVPLGDATFTFGDTPNEFAALTLTSQDQKPVAVSQKLLLTVVDRVENTGMEWNADHTSVGNHWGAAPSLADGVPVTVALHVNGPRYVYSLDSQGRHAKAVPSTYGNGVLRFSVGPEYTALWYSVEP